MLAAGAAVPTSAAVFDQNRSQKPKIKRYKPFGKTGFMVGDISSGAGQGDPGLVNHLFDCGVNLVDTAIAYGNHEEVLGQALSKAQRSKLFICTKWEPELVTATVTKQALLEALDTQLTRLKTDYVDCLMIHSYGDPELGDITRIQNPAIYEAFEEAKKLGKIKFSGASSHGALMLEETEWALDNDAFEVLLLGANFLTRGLEPLLKRARDKGVATIAMKTMTTYKSSLNIREHMDRETNARQAVIKHILATDLFDTMVIGMRNYEQVNEYLSVSGTTSLTEEDNQDLAVIASNISNKYCRPGCDGCMGTCPNNVPVWDILRYKMYFENYGEEKRAMAHYSKMPVSRTPVNCESCSAPCEDACKYNLPIRERLIEAHKQLTLA